jgi:hypothetical protein
VASCSDGGEMRVEDVELNESEPVGLYLLVSGRDSMNRDVQSHQRLDKCGFPCDSQR